MISDSGDRDRCDSNYLLLTGATGLLGRYLMRDLLRQGCRLAVLVRPSAKDPAHARIERILQHWEDETDAWLPRPVILEGDIAEPNCGLSGTQLRWVSQHVGSILHNAAVLSFESNSRSAEPWVTNVDGTRGMLDLAKQCRIDDFHFVSTAYVCGNAPQPILEDQLDVGQGFRNDYERSKYEAEKLVRAADHLSRVTIYRPAVIAGDSTTGYTSTFHGLYLYLRLMSILVPGVEPDANGIRHTNIRVPMTGNEPRNIVPVDWVSEVICYLFGKEEAHGRAFHIAPDRRITPREVVEYGYSYFNSTGVVYCGNDYDDEAEATPFERAFLENMKQYASYDHTDPQFDRSNLLKFAPHLPCPTINEEVMHRYLRFGEQQRWGKMKQKPVKVDRDVHDHLESLRRSNKRVFSIDDLASRHHHLRLQTPADSHSGENAQFVLGLDLLGRGGGQWHLVGNAAAGYEVRLGLPDVSMPTLQLATEEFRSLIDSQQGPLAQHVLNVHDSADLSAYDDILTGFARSFDSASLL